MEENDKKNRFNKNSVYVVLIIFVSLLLIFFIVKSTFKIKQLENDINLKDSQIYILNNTISDLRQENLDYSKKVVKYDKQINFMDEYVVICPLNGSGLYHRYGCSDFDWTSSFSFMVYNVEQAPNEGFSPCKYCSNLDNTTDEKTEIVYIANDGTKYHRSWCSYLKSKKAITKEEAIEQGYSACSRCKP